MPLATLALAFQQTESAAAMATAEAIHKKVILQSWKDWKIWLISPKALATSKKVWQFVDPDQSTELGNAPVRPRPSDIVTTATMLSDLTEPQMRDFKYQMEEYRDDLQEYKRQEKALEEVNAHIIQSIAPRYLYTIQDKVSPRDKLKALKAEAAPTTMVRTLEAQSTYRRLLRTVRTKDLDNWLQEWEQALTEATEADIPDTKGVNGLTEFLTAVQSAIPDFCTHWKNKILDIYTEDPNAVPGKELPSLFKLTEHFRNAMRHHIADAAHQKVAFAATLNGRPSTTPGQGQEATGRQPKCICGKRHEYKLCYHLNESIRPSGWTLNQKTLENINNRLKNDEKLRETIKKHTGYVAKTEDLAQPKESVQQQENKPNSFATTVVAQVTATLTDPDSYPRPAEETYVLCNSTILDSGSSIHIFNDRSRFRDFRPAPADSSVLTGGGNCLIEGYGTVDVTVQTDGDQQSTIELRDTAYCPSFQCNIASMRRFARNNVFFDQGKMILEWKGTTLAKVHDLHDQYVLEWRAPVQHHAFAASQKPRHYPTSRDPRPDKIGTLMDWHERLGHPGVNALNHLVEATTGAIVTDPDEPLNCEACAQGKATKVISRRPPRRQTTRPFQYFHFDLFENIRGLGNGRWALLFTDIHTGMAFFYVLSSKSEIFPTLKSFLQWIKRQYGQEVQGLTTDGERSLGNAFVQYGKDEGIDITITPRATSALNGPAERAGGVVFMKSRVMRIQARLPEALWPEITRTAVLLHNMTPSEAHGWKAPHTILHEWLQDNNIDHIVRPSLPDLAHLVKFGARAYPLTNAAKEGKERTHKLQERAHIGYLVGYVGTNVYRIWLPDRNEVIATRDVRFDENTTYDPAEEGITPIPQGIQDPWVECVEVLELPDLGSEEATEPTPEDFDDEPLTKDSITVATSPQIAQEATPPSSPPLELPLDINIIPAQSELTEQLPSDSEQLSRSPESDIQLSEQMTQISEGINVLNILPEGSQRRRKKSARAAGLMTYYNLIQPHTAFHTAFNTALQHRMHRSTLPPAPRNWKEAMESPFRPQWMTAAQAEWTKLQQQRVMEEVQRIEAKSTPLRLGWVFGYKFDEDDYLVRFKARLVVRGNQQPYTGKDTYASTLAARTLRVLLALMAKFGLEAMQFDVVSAFTNSINDEEIWVEYPDGYRVRNACLRLLKALYGLRRAPLLWQRLLTEFLKEIGLQPVSEDSCVYLNDKIILFYFVDDLIVLYRPEDQAEAETFKEKLMARFEVRLLGKPQWFLGIRIIRDMDQGTLSICQDTYIDKVIHQFHLEGRTVPQTPAPVEELLPYDGRASPEATLFYQTIVGSLIYLVVTTRVDIAFTVSKLAQFMNNPSPIHHAVAEHCLLYLWGTKYLGIQYRRDGTDEGPEAFICASDASFADNSIDRKSSQAFVMKLFGGPVAWKANKQDTVTTSSTEAELLAMTSAAREMCSMKRLFDGLRLQLGFDPSIYCDNLQAIGIITKTAQQLQTKLKHVDIHQLWLRQEYQQGRVDVDWVESAKMPADGLTKFLPKKRFADFIKMLGMVDLKAMIVVKE